MRIYGHICVCIQKFMHSAAILGTIEGPFQVFGRFSSSKLVLRTVESCFVALNYYENGSIRLGINILL